MNNGIISKAALEARRAMYKPDSRVELVSTTDPYTSLKPGDKGTVCHIDDIGTVFVAWDNGSTLGMAYGADEIKYSPLPVSDTVFKEIMAVRATGKSNMLDRNAVQRIAMEMGFYDLADFIEADPKAYSTFIITGGREQ